MSSTDRLNRLLLAEDWKRVYQSYKNAEFQSYDFDTLRRTMIQYLRDNYPEDFNDYIESSEYLALIDLIAFLGQNLSYRIDLNANNPKDRKKIIYNTTSSIKDLHYNKDLKQLLSIVYQPELIDKFNKDDQQIINYQCNQPKYKEFFDNHTTCDTMNKLFYITDAQTYLSFNYLLFGKLNVPKDTCVLHLAGSVNGNKYLSELGYDISKVKDINILFKLQQLININRKLSLFIVIIICIIIYLFYHMIHKILQKI